MQRHVEHEIFAGNLPSVVKLVIEYLTRKLRIILTISTTLCK